MIRDAVMVSLRTGVLAALLATLLGTLAGIAMARRPGRWAGWFIGLLLIVSAFVQVSGSTPWPVYVLSALRSGLRPEIAAVSTIMLAVTLLALSLVGLVLKRAGDSATDIARTMGGG